MPGPAGSSSVRCEPWIVFSLLAASKDTERALGKPWLLCDRWIPGSRGLSPESCQNCWYSLPTSFTWRTNATKLSQSCLGIRCLHLLSLIPLSPFPQALPYVCLLIAMLFFIYAIIGMQVKYWILSFWPWVCSGNKWVVAFTAGAALIWDEAKALLVWCQVN